MHVWVALWFTWLNYQGLSLFALVEFDEVLASREANSTDNQTPFYGDESSTAEAEVTSGVSDYDDSAVDMNSHFSHVYSSDELGYYDNSSVMAYGDIDTSDSPERAREKLMKVNPNLVRFIERVIKMRTHKFEHGPNTWWFNEENEYEDLASFCFYSPNGACHIHVDNFSPALKYKELYADMHGSSFCRLHPKYLTDSTFSKRGQSKGNQKGASDVVLDTKSMNDSKNRRYKCELNHNIFPANQSGLVKSVLPEQFIKLINGSRSCILAVFFSPYCPFSVKMTPQINALARNFPEVHVVAVNALLNRNLDSRLGVVGTPSLIFFYNDQAVGRYSTSDLKTMSGLLSNLTGLMPGSGLDLLPRDHLPGPLPVKIVPHFHVLGLLSTLIFTSFVAALAVHFTSTGRVIWSKVEQELREIPLMQFFLG